MTSPHGTKPNTMTHQKSLSKPGSSANWRASGDRRLSTCSGLLRYRTRPLTGYSKPNPEGFKPTHKWHPIYRKRDESSEELWKRIADHRLPVDEFPREIDGVHVIAAIEGFLVTLDPRGWWPVLHPSSPNAIDDESPRNEA